ncbi:MAG TPA: hypothetical protein VI356_02645 [Myxococcales bacterium]
MRLDGDTWRPVGDNLETDVPLASWLRQVSIAANGDSVAVAYPTASDIAVATLAASGWRVSSAATHGGARIASLHSEIGPSGKLLVSWDQDSALQVALFDGSGWRLLPDAAEGFHLLYAAALRADGVPIAFFERGFENPAPPYDFATGTWKDGAWNLSQLPSTGNWNNPALSRDGDALFSVLTGGSISFTALHTPP